VRLGGQLQRGGSYGISNVPPTGSSHAFVVSEQHGIWGNAKTFPVQAIQDADRSAGPAPVPPGLGHPQRGRDHALMVLREQPALVT
jgi:hypothetical protein